VSLCSKQYRETHEDGLIGRSCCECHHPYYLSTCHTMCIDPHGYLCALVRQQVPFGWRGRKPTLTSLICVVSWKEMACSLALSSEKDCETTTLAGAMIFHPLVDPTTSPGGVGVVETVGVRQGCVICPIGNEWRVEQLQLQRHPELTRYRPGITACPACFSGQVYSPSQIVQSSLTPDIQTYVLQGQHHDQPRVHISTA